MLQDNLRGVTYHQNDLGFSGSIFSRIKKRRLCPYQICLRHELSESDFV